MDEKTLSARIPIDQYDRLQRVLAEFQKRYPELRPTQSAMLRMAVRMFVEQKEQEFGIDPES